MTVKKHLRAQEVALHNHLPCITCRLRRRVPSRTGSTSSGPRPLRPDLLQPGHHVSKGIPQIAAVLGSCHRRRRLRAGDDDQAVIVRNQGTIFLGGRRCEGGHRRGVTARAGRRRPALPHLRRHRPLATRRARAADVRSIVARSARARRRWQRHPRCPRVDERQLYVRVPTDSRTGYDVHEVIAGRDAAVRRVQGRVRVDAGHRGSRTSTATRRHRGQQTALLFSESAMKGAHFIELCDQRSIPLVYLQNITGFMVGRVRGGGIASTARSWSRDACARVPSHGGDRRLVRRRHYAMSGARTRPGPLDVAERAISVMGGEQAATVLSIGAPGGRSGPEDDSRRPSASSTSSRATVLLDRPALGRRRDRPGRHAHGAAPRASTAANAPLEPVRYGVFRCDRRASRTPVSGMSLYDHYHSRVLTSATERLAVFDTVLIANRARSPCG